jgi:choloylglycine hydrolase
MMRKLTIMLLVLFGLLPGMETRACSVLYYIDAETGKIYVVNNEDYWYDVEAYIQINPAKGNELARLWYGWDDFAQGGINEAGLFFDGAVTPEQELEGGGKGPRGNLGDDILARCRTVEEALDYLEKRKIALKNAHMMLGDASGQAVVVEWTKGQRSIVPISNKRLIMTNFLLSDTAQGNYPCPRYQSIEQRLDQMEEAGQPIDLKTVGNAMAGAVQVPRTMENERKGGTLYSSFINISDMEFVLVYQLDNARITRLDLVKEFKGRERKRVDLE